MTSLDPAYLALRRHLNRQAVGFPATRSGVELRLLKHIFTPAEARLATRLTFRPEPLATLFERAGDLAASPAELETMLEAMRAKGGVEAEARDGRRCYANAPLVVGMYEYQLDRLTPEFVADFNAYTSTLKFGVELLSTRLPQMRTIPVARSIRPQHYAAGFDEVAALVQAADGPFVVVACICRRKKGLEGHTCKVTAREETCLAMGSMAETARVVGSGREISRGEALALLERNQKEGLVLQPSNTQRADFICSCCGCCCGMLRLHQMLPKPLEFWASNFLARVDADACDGCGTCRRRCQVGAVAIDENGGPAKVNEGRCLGCGVCVPTCKAQAIALVKKPAETAPPQTREDLYATIMAHKKGRLGKWRLTAKLVSDALRNGGLKRLRSLSVPPRR